MGLNKPNKIILHHLAAPINFGAEECDLWHKTRWRGFASKKFKNENGEFYHVGYHYIIERDGKIVQCRDHSEEGAHCIGQNTSSIGIAFSGNFNKAYPSAPQMESLWTLYNKISVEFPEITLNHIFPHRRFSFTDCYGTLLEDDFFTRYIQKENIKLIESLKLRIEQLMTKLYSLLSANNKHD